MQKTIEKNGWCQNGRTESESYGGAQTYMWIVDDNLVEVQLGKDDLLERILSPDNLLSAYKQVVRNHGAGGVDKMGTSELLPYLNLHLGEHLHLCQIASQLENRRMPNGTYGGVRGRKTKVGGKLTTFVFLLLDYIYTKIFLYL